MSLFSKKNRILVAPKCDEMSFVQHETYRLLRTNILFSLSGDKPNHIIGITSSIKGESKSTTTINLAYVLAEDGKKVCVVEADMHLPTLKTNFKLNSQKGLSELLTAQATFEEVVEKVSFEKCSFDCIAAGTISPNSAELLSSAKMSKLLETLGESYDYVLIDFPPVTLVTDVCVVGGKLDGIVMCVAQGRCKKKTLNMAVRQLTLSRIKILGFVRTFVTESSLGYNKYDDKYDNKYVKVHSKK